jgi:hypothetical protein
MTEITRQALEAEGWGGYHESPRWDDGRAEFVHGTGERWWLSVHVLIPDVHRPSNKGAGVYLYVGSNMTGLPHINSMEQLAMLLEALGIDKP